jgi:nuclear pore complex protein Nup133
MHPRIQLLLEGILISVQFGDAVALCARGSFLSNSIINRCITNLFLLDSEYRDRLELKSATDRTLGVGVVQSDSTVLILTAATMMKASIDLETVLTFDSEYVSFVCCSSVLNTKTAYLIEMGMQSSSNQQ